MIVMSVSYIHLTTIYIQIFKGCNFQSFHGQLVSCKIFIILSRLTVVSHKAKKKQHACTSSGLHDHYSELFTRMVALKF